MDRFGEAVPLSSGTWSMIGAPPVRRDRPASAMDHAALDGLDEEPRILGGQRVPDDLHPLRRAGGDVGGGPARRREGRRRAPTSLRRVFYPAQRTEPLRDATVYVVNDGRLYADSVRAIYEERVRRGDDREHIWVVKDGAFVPPARGSATVGHVVRAGSREHYAALARSRYIVTNAFLPAWFRAREDQVVVQTWHGTPVKRIGNDQPHMTRDPSPPIWHRQAAEVRGWDLLLSQIPWATPVLRKAFGYQGEVLESGLPAQRRPHLARPGRAGRGGAAAARAWPRASGGPLRADLA